MVKGNCRYCGKEAFYCEGLFGFVCVDCHIKLADVFNAGFTGSEEPCLFQD